MVVVVLVFIVVKRNSSLEEDYENLWWQISGLLIGLLGLFLGKETSSKKNDKHEKTYEYRPYDTPIKPSDTPIKPSGTPIKPSGKLIKHSDKLVKPLTTTGQHVVRVKKTNYTVGGFMAFGYYNGKDILWRIIEIFGKWALLLSEYILEKREYNEKRVNITWEKCTLRKYLNGEFYNNHFSSSEKSKILHTHAINSNNVYTAISGKNINTNGGNDTDDYIFLLNINEVKNIKYFDTKEVHIETTIFKNAAKKNPELYPPYILTSDKLIARYADSDFYWLMSPGNIGRRASGVSNNRYVDIIGGDVDYKGGVRPALWLDLKS